jgi:hypothetical protein
MNSSSLESLERMKSPGMPDLMKNNVLQPLLRDGERHWKEGSASECPDSALRSNSSGSGEIFPKLPVAPGIIV